MIIWDIHIIRQHLPRIWKIYLLINGGGAKIASGSNLLSVNEESMKQSFIGGYPVIVPIKGSSIYNPLYDPNQKNPAINNHFVVFYAYTIKPSTYYFFDPYYGQVKTVPGTELKNLVQGNMPYLKAAPY